MIKALPHYPEAIGMDLGISTLSLIPDRRALTVAGQPEVREYRMRYWEMAQAWENGARLRSWSSPPNQGGEAASPGRGCREIGWR